MISEFTNAINYTFPHEESAWWTEEQIKSINQGMIQQIVTHKIRGLNLNLFIGRSALEPLPEDSSDTLWVSLSIFQQKTSLKDRLHLIVDCNDVAQMQTIQSLFNTVVVDLSTRKFFSDQGLLNIYGCVDKGGSLFIEEDLHGGVLRIDDQESYILENYNYICQFRAFVADFMLKNFNLSLDLENIKGNIAYAEEIEVRKDLIAELEEYKAWKAVDEVDYDFNDLLMFFSYLAEKQGMINPSFALSKVQTKEEIETRTQEMSECFEEVKFMRDTYPYKNNYDRDGTCKSGFFHATGKK